MRLIGVAAFSAGLALAAPAQQRAEPEGDGPITIDAESLTYDQKGDTVSATGDVLIRRGDTTLSADTVEYNRRTSEARALGDAVLTSPDADIQAGAMFLDLDDETGELHEAQIESQRLRYSISGDRIQKGSGQRYHIENGRFTTCDCAEGAPDWSIAAKQLDIELDGYGSLEGGTFNILDVPVLWLPRAAFPAFRERQTGLLIPRVGFSNRRGFQILQPVYWAINKSQDATLSFDLETSLRLGLVGEYRYAFSPENEGQFQAGYFYQYSQTTDVIAPKGADKDTPNNRWGVIGDHTQRLGGEDGPLGYVDLMLVGDDLFLREMNTFALDYRQEVNLRTKPFTTSQVGILQTWERAVLQADATFYQDLVGPVVELPPGPTPTPGPGGQPNATNTPQFTERESLVIQRLPEARFAAQKQLGFGILGDLRGSVTNFQRSLGLAGFRADIKPAAELRLPLPRAMYGIMRLGFRETAYALTESHMNGGFTGDDPTAPPINLPSGSTREIFELHTTVGTQLARVFDFPHFGLDKLKHTIEPQVEYFYVPPVDQDDLPVFDGIDRINKRSLFTYGFATRLLGRRAGAAEGDRGEVFELTRLSIAQSYDVLRDIPPTSRLDDVTGEPVNPGQTGDHFSDIDVALRINPNRTTSVRTYTTYDPSENQISSTTIGIRLTEPLQTLDPKAPPRLWTRASFNVEYRFITDSILQLIDSAVTLPLTDRIALLYAMRFDINDNSFLENYGGLRLLSSCDCWALTLGISNTRNPNEVQVQTQFTLTGLGASGLAGFDLF
ncbi:MAG: LPS-assembly protein LptD [Candidatus Binatia bacterium]